jgi:biofilm PGA synthesis N-glycosyltransferase PgaC
MPICAKNYSFNNEQLPVVSFIVPVYNENKMIESRISNFNQIDYPAGKLEVVIVDGGSKDGTVEALEKYGKDAHFTLKVIRQGSRKGFNSAVVEGFYQTTGEIIFITGAETQYASNAVKLLVNHFADPEVGAVNGTVRLSNMAAGMSTKIESAYRTSYDFIRTAESKMDTPFDIKGEIAAARRNVCQKLIEKPEMLKKGCVDACFSFQAKVDGLKTVYDPLAVYSEPAPKSLRESFKQQIRRAATLIQNLLLFKKLMGKSKYGLFGLLIMPVHFMMLIVLPYIFLFSILGLILLLATNPLNIIAISMLVLGLIGLSFSQGIRAFFKVQIALIIATLKMVTGIETQKFERLFSAR